MNGVTNIRGYVESVSSTAKTAQQAAKDFFQDTQLNQTRSRVSEYPFTSTLHDSPVWIVWGSDKQSVIAAFGDISPSVLKKCLTL